MKLNPGDVLVQKKGQPWVFLVWLFTGQRFPHAVLIKEWRDDGVIHASEAVWQGVKRSTFRPSDLERYECWRPSCEAAIKQKALTWVENHLGQGYGYWNAFCRMLKHRFGLDFHPGMDDDCGRDDRDMICSELIAMAYFRAGYDLVPGVCDVETMPADLRNPDRLVRVF